MKTPDEWDMPKMPSIKDIIEQAKFTDLPPSEQERYKVESAVVREVVEKAYQVYCDECRARGMTEPMCWSAASALAAMLRAATGVTHPDRKLALQLFDSQVQRRSEITMKQDDEREAMERGA